MSTVSGLLSGRGLSGSRSEAPAPRTDRPAATVPSGSSGASASATNGRDGDAVTVSVSSEAAAMIAAQVETAEENRRAARSAHRIVELASERAPPPAEGTLRFHLGLLRQG